jgi:glutamate racemase
LRSSFSTLRTEGPIGVFDSGLGGLRLVDALAKRLPREDIVFLGDTARSPYGTRGKQTVFNYCHACARVLRDHRMKLLVLACSTASAVAQAQLAAELFLPVVGPIVPGLQAALATGASRIGVLTSAYLARSGEHARALVELGGAAGVYAQNSQLLCAFLDDGVWEGELLQRALREQLTPLVQAGVQCVVLSEGQLPALRGAASAELAAMGGKQVRVVDAIDGMVESVVQLLEGKQLGTTRTDPGKLRVVLTDPPEDKSIAERYLGRALSGITLSSVDL